MAPVLHFAIPFALAALLGFRLKWALAVGLIAMLPDLDIFFTIDQSITSNPLSVFLLTYLRLYQ